MNVIAFPTAGAVRPASAEGLRAAAEGSQEQAPKDTFLGSVKKEARDTAVRWGNASGTVFGGAIGLSVVTAGLYAGVLGGAVVLGMLGGGLGPAVAAVGSKGILGFIGTSFRTAGFFAKTGMVLGAATGAVGGWAVGNAIGGVAGKLPGAAAGAVVGAGKGAWEHIEKKAGGN